MVGHLSCGGRNDSDMLTTYNTSSNYARTSTMSLLDFAGRDVSIQYLVLRYQTLSHISLQGVLAMACQLSLFLYNEWAIPGKARDLHRACSRAVLWCLESNKTLGWWGYQGWCVSIGTAGNYSKTTAFMAFPKAAWNHFWIVPRNDVTLSHQQ